MQPTNRWFMNIDTNIALNTPKVGKKAPEQASLATTYIQNTTIRSDSADAFEHLRILYT